MEPYTSQGVQPSKQQYSKFSAPLTFCFVFMELWSLTISYWIISWFTHIGDDGLCQNVNKNLLSVENS